MAKDTHFRRVALFTLRLLVIAPFVLAAWWTCLPVYARGVGEVAAFVLKHVYGYPVQHVVVHAAGLLNTNTTLGFDLGTRVPTITISEVLTNLATFTSLVLATRRLTWVKRLRGLMAGAFLLAVSHVLYIVIFLVMAKTIARYPQVPTAIGQIVVTLPFLLWIVLAYWGTLQSMVGTPNELVSNPSNLSHPPVDDVLTENNPAQESTVPPAD